MVASLKVTPSVEFAEVCSASLRKMSSCSLSGVEVLLRVTVALPVSVATLPIGSSAAGWAAEGAAAGAWAGAAGWACANRIRPGVASSVTCPASTDDGIAKTLAVPASKKLPKSQTASKNRRITNGS